MRYIILIIIISILILKIINIVIKKSLIIDLKDCAFLDGLYINWCIKSYNKTYYEYMGGGIGNRIKGIIELLSLSFANNHYPQSINSYKFIVSIEME